VLESDLDSRGVRRHPKQAQLFLDLLKLEALQMFSLTLSAKFGIGGKAS